MGVRQLRVLSLSPPGASTGAAAYIKPELRLSCQRPNQGNEAGAKSQHRDMRELPLLHGNRDRGWRYSSEGIPADTKREQLQLPMGLPQTC